MMSVVRSVLITFILFPPTLPYSYPYVTPNYGYYGAPPPGYSYGGNYGSATPYQTSPSPYHGYSYSYMNPYGTSYWNPYGTQSYQNPSSSYTHGQPSYPSTHAHYPNYQHAQSYPSSYPIKSRKRNHLTHAHKDYDKYDSSDRYHDTYSDRYSDRYYDTRYHDRYHNHGYEYPRYDYKKSGYNYNIKHDRDANSYGGANFHKPYHRDRYQSFNHGKEESKYESEVIRVHDSPNRLSNPHAHSSDHPFMSHLITDKLGGGVIIQPESSTEDGAEEEEEPEEVFDDRPRFVGRGTVEINNNKAIFSCFLFDAKYEMTSPIDWVKITGPYEYTSKGGVLPYVCSGVGSCTYEFIAVSAAPKQDRFQTGNTRPRGQMAPQHVSDQNRQTALGIQNQLIGVPGQSMTSNATKYESDYQIKYPLAPSRIKTLSDSQLSFLIISDPNKSDEGYYRCSGVQTSIADGRNQTFFQIIKYFPDDDI